MLMKVLITYDVSTMDTGGRARLRHVSSICRNYGIKVQNSVFECNVTPSQRIMLENDLTNAINPNYDSLRIYDLGNIPESKIKHIGVRQPIDLGGTLLF